MFDGVFQDLEPEEIAGVCSAFVFPEKPWSPEEIVDATPALAKARKRVDDLHVDLEKLQNKFRVTCDSEEFWKLCHFGFADTAYRWACGETFGDIRSTSHLQEGTIVRVIVRLEELMRKVRVAARLMHNTPLMEKLDKASELIKRDVAFAASLYVE